MRVTRMYRTGFRHISSTTKSNRRRGKLFFNFPPPPFQNKNTTTTNKKLFSARLYRSHRECVFLTGSEARRNSRARTITRSARRLYDYTIHTTYVCTILRSYWKTNIFVSSDSISIVRLVFFFYQENIPLTLLRRQRCRFVTLAAIT